MTSLLLGSLGGSSSPSHKCHFLTLTSCPEAFARCLANLILTAFWYTDHFSILGPSLSHVNSYNLWITTQRPPTAHRHNNTNIYLKPKHIAPSFPDLFHPPSPSATLSHPHSPWPALALVRSGFDTSIYRVIQAKNREVIRGNSFSLSSCL